MEVVVVIVGAGPAGLATAACLKQFSIQTTLLEKEDYCASLWRNRSYDRLKLHLSKEFCSLPHLSIPPSTPKFVPRQGFIQYMDDYVEKFQLCPLYCRCVESATFDHFSQRWQIKVKNTTKDEMEVYNAQFLVVASGENSEGIIPKLPGLDSFLGETIHSSQYKSGDHFFGRKTLVVGCGNSGMEIAYDLCSHGVDTSIVVRNPVHILNKEIVYIGMTLLRFLSVSFVDYLVMLIARIKYGDLSKYGLLRPQGGPFYLKDITGRSPVIDVGTVDMIKGGQIKVYSEIENIEDDVILFRNGKEQAFGAIIFATGYKSTTNHWLKDFYCILNDSGMPKTSYPNHWKGENNVYCVGFSRRGLAGISKDAKVIAEDIKLIIENKKKNILKPKRSSKQF